MSVGSIVTIVLGSVFAYSFIGTTFYFWLIKHDIGVRSYPCLDDDKTGAQQRAVMWPFALTAMGVRKLAQITYEQLFEEPKEKG